MFRVRCSVFDVFPATKRQCGAPRSGFTLIEMLVVISIMALLAGLVVWGTARAATARKLNRVRTELHQLETVIDEYHQEKGFYPPDNTNDATRPPLFYELTGTKYDSGNTHFATAKGDFIKQGDVYNAFRIQGFANSNPEDMKNFFPEMKSAQHRTFTNFAGNPLTRVDLLVVPLPGPADLPSNDADERPLNPWRYVSTKPTNNAASYDLWADVVIGGKVHTVGNWKE